MNYKEETQIKNQQKLNIFLEELPGFCRTYFNGRENRLSAVTAVSYASNLRIFFEYLHDNNGYFKNRAISTYTLEDISLLRSEDIEEFAHWMRFHEKDGRIYRSSQATIEHYLSSISCLYTYYIKRNHLAYNPVDAIDRSKKVKKEIIRLEGDEKRQFVESVQHGTGLSNRQLKFHKKNSIRDTTIIQLFLDTGMRISELVGINLTDINFEKHCVSIIRKGGNQQLIYFSDEVEELIKECINDRHSYRPLDEEQALFLNRDGNRLSVRSVEILTKKYVKSSAIGNDKITPHKLRSTFATDMLNATGDIELVSEQLGHSSLNTTKVYADYNESKRSSVRNIPK